MRITTITVGRVYNTHNYTSQRYEATASLESEDDFAHALVTLAEDLDAYAQDAMQKMERNAKKQRGDEPPF